MEREAEKGGQVVLRTQLRLETLYGICLRICDLWGNI